MFDRRKLVDALQAARLPDAEIDHYPVVYNPDGLRIKAISDNPARLQGSRILSR